MLTERQLEAIENGHGVQAADPDYDRGLVLSSTLEDPTDFLNYLADVGADSIILEDLVRSRFAQKMDPDPDFYKQLDNALSAQMGDYLDYCDEADTRD